MNRNQSFTTLEFIDDQVRICVGEYFNNNFHIFDTFSTYSKGYKNGLVTDEFELSKSISNLMDIARDRAPIENNEIVLCLPSNDLIISRTTSTSAVLGKNSLICEDDLKSSLKIASKVRHEENEEIIDLVPIEFTLDNGEILDFAPLGYRSATFKTLFNVLKLPSNILNSYLNAIEMSKFVMKNYYLDINCLYKGSIIEEDLDISILDLSKSNIKMLIYRKGKILERLYLNQGIDSIISALIEKYEVDYKTANNLLLYYSNAQSGNSTNRTIYKISKENKIYYIKDDELSKIVETSLINLLTPISSKIENKLNEMNLDVVITGFGSIIKNIDSLIAKVLKKESSCYKSNILGLREPNNAQTIGIIKLNANQSKHMNLQPPADSGIIENKSEDESDNFSKFIVSDDDFDEQGEI